MAYRTFILSAVSALALSGCAVGPDRVSPSPPSPSATSGPFLSAQTDIVTANPLPQDWWRLYEDPVLDGLVADALGANTDIRQAVARMDRARAALRGARSDRLPTVGLTASAAYSRTPEFETPPGADRTGTGISLGADVSYEVDLFGRVSGQISASRNDLAAAQADADAVRVMVVADTTLAYANAASAAARIDVARSIVALLDDSLRLTRRRHEVGMADGLAVARIQSLRDQRAATIPEIEAQRSAALFA